MKDIQIEDPKVKPTVYKGRNCYQLITGEIGMDRETLAASCGVDKTAINYLIKKRSSSNLAPWLSAFANRDVELTRLSLSKKGKPRSILRWDFCAAVIAYYATPKPEPKGKPDRRDRRGKKRKKRPETASESLITSYYFPE